MIITMVTVLLSEPVEQQRELLVADQLAFP
jgi:hypothetical protein